MGFAISAPSSSSPTVISTSATASAATASAAAAASSNAHHHAALREAVRELSGGTATSLSAPPTETLAALATEDPAHMKVDELSALATATFQGVPGVLAADPGKAVALWRVAAARGSLDAAYSLAVCLRDGKGAEKDAGTAYGMLHTLARDHNYNMAHVRGSELGRNVPVPSPDLLLLLCVLRSTRSGSCFWPATVPPRCAFGLPP